MVYCVGLFYCYKSYQLRTMWLNIPYRKKYKKQIHWIIFVILNFVGGCFGILFSIDKVKYKKGEGIILFTTYLAILGCWLFGVNYLI